MRRKLYTTIEVAKAAGVPRATLQHWIKTGKIAAPPVRLRDNRAVRLWTEAQRKRIRTLSGTFKSGPKKAKAADAVSRRPRFA
jgi:DNA-binding transcriptional MerR regulator